MDRQTLKAQTRHAQSLALIAFFIVGALLYWSFSLLGYVHSKGLRDVLEMTLSVACFFAIFLVNPLTDYFLTRLTRR